MSIHWSSISRNDTLLAEAGEDTKDGAVVDLAHKLLKKKPTPGWEFQRSRRAGGLRGIKFHVYEDAGWTKQADDPSRLIWVFSCVTDMSLEEQQAKSFLEKLVYISEPMRHESNSWRHGNMLSCQGSFAPILVHHMENVAFQGKLAMVNQEINSAKEIMADNIDMMLAREETLEQMQDRATKLSELSKQFKKNSRKVKRFKMWQNAKHGLALGTAVTAGVGVVVVPPLVALLL